VNVSIKISSYYFRNDVEKAVAVHGKPDLFSCMRPERMRRLCTPEASDLVWMPAIKWRMDSQFSFAYASSPGMSMGFFSSSVEITPKEALSPLRKKERKKGDFKRTHGHGKGGRERSLPSGIGVLEVLPKWRAHNELPPVLGADFKGFSMAASCSLHRGQISRNQKRRQKTATTAKNKLESLGSTPRLEHAQGDGFLFRVHINESHDVHFCQLRQRSSSRQGRSKVRMERKRKKERKKKEKKKKERERKTERQPGRWVGASRAGPPCPFGVFQ